MQCKRYSFGAYKVTTKKENTGSNYNVAVHIRKNKSLIGGFFWKNDKIHELTPIINKTIEEYENQEDLFNFNLN